MFSFDFVFACSILLLIISVLVFQAGYSLKRSQESADKLLLMNEANFLGDLFFEEGYPKNWTLSEARVVGLSSNGRLDSEKLDNFGVMDYQQSIMKLGLKHDYNISVFCGSSLTYSFGSSYINSSSIVKSDRLGVFKNGSFATIKVIVFER